VTSTTLVPRQDEWAGARPSHASLSVCCLTGGRYLPRLAAILGLLRPLADEIVVGVDDCARDSVGLLGSVADRILLFSHADPSDRPIAWLIRQCAGDWVFNIDDDEVPSAELLGELRGLTARSDITHCWVARRWLYPDPSTYLDQPPWSTEYQLRVFRADDRSLRFTDQFHRPVACTGPARFVEAPVWHLDTALASREERQRKAIRYERARRGMRIGAFSHNTGLYLPELHGELRLADVPPRELATIKEILLAPARRVVGVPVDEPSPDAVRGYSSKGSCGGQCNCTHGRRRYCKYRPHVHFAETAEGTKTQRRTGHRAVARQAQRYTRSHIVLAGRSGCAGRRTSDQRSVSIYAAE